MARGRLGAAADDLERSLRGGLLVPLLSTFGLVDRDREPAVREVRRGRRSLARASAHSLLRAGRSQPDRDRQARGAHLRRRGRACSAGSSSSSHGRRSGARSGRLPRTPTRPGSSASTRGRQCARRRARARDGRARRRFLGMRSTFDPYAGQAQLIFAFEAVVIGGMVALGHARRRRSCSASLRPSAARWPEGWQGRLGGPGAGHVVLPRRARRRLVSRRSRARRDRALVGRDVSAGAEQPGSPSSAGQDVVASASARHAGRPARLGPASSARTRRTS